MFKMFLTFTFGEMIQFDLKKILSTLCGQKPPSTIDFAWCEELINESQKKLLTEEILHQLRLVVYSIIIFLHPRGFSRRMSSINRRALEISSVFDLRTIWWSCTTTLILGLDTIRVLQTIKGPMMRVLSKQPFKRYSSNWIISPVRGENKRDCCFFDPWPCFFDPSLFFWPLTTLFFWPLATLFFWPLATLFFWPLALFSGPLAI